jgi:hypothetical protein
MPWQLYVQDSSTNHNLWASKTFKRRASAVIAYDSIVPGFVYAGVHGPLWNQFVDAPAFLTQRNDGA